LTDPFSDAKVRRIDKQGVHSTYEKWPALAREGFRVKVELPARTARNAFILGMGGSASGGDIIAGWLSNRQGIEVAVFKGQLPVEEMRGSIAIAVSASGQTQETVQMLRTAVQRHATAITISGGGVISEEAAKLGVPHIQMPKVVAPRYMLPFIISSTLAVVNRGLGLDCEEEAEGAFAAMETEGNGLRQSVSTSKNPAKQLALKIYRKTPSIYGARVTRGVGIRFKNVLNENSKKHAHFDGIPDVFHNEIEAWEDPRVDFVPIFLRHTAESGRDRTREDEMVSMLDDSGKDPIEVRGGGNSDLSQLLTMVYRLDITSYYTAIGLGRDPFPTKLLDTLKKGN
jgi:glucose/mannose-6-phosphate isomerase